MRLNGTAWTTDKHGPIMDLLAAESTARTGKDPGEHYREMTAEFGTPFCARIDAPTTPEQKPKVAVRFQKPSRKLRYNAQLRSRLSDLFEFSTELRTR